MGAVNRGIVDPGGSLRGGRKAARLEQARGARQTGVGESASRPFRAYGALIVERLASKSFQPSTAGWLRQPFGSYDSITGVAPVRFQRSPTSTWKICRVSTRCLPSRLSSRIDADRAKSAYGRKV